TGDAMGAAVHDAHAASAENAGQFELENALAEQSLWALETRKLDLGRHLPHPTCRTNTYCRLSMFEEHRRTRRAPLNILLNKYIEGEPHVCRAVNLSSGGMLVYKVFEPDMATEEVSIEFQLPGSSRVLRADCVALQEHRWARAHGMRFVRMA